MKILIVSDSHGYDDNMWNAIHKEEPVDMFIHCGDIEHLPNDLKEYFSCPVYVIKGNNDYALNLPEVERFKILDLEVLLIHGHHYNIYRNCEAMFYLGQENKVDIVMFGHIHIPVIDNFDGVTIVNPGSISLPRQANGLPSYIVMNIEKGKEPEYNVKYIE
ncbi:MAG: metallophosphoesterase [Lachnospiraceae bacterium]|nr:metallophosphoesterase [Lachnospiraceae bacterium]